MFNNWWAPKVYLDLEAGPSVASVQKAEIVTFQPLKSLMCTEVVIYQIRNTVGRTESNPALDKLAEVWE